MNRSALKRLKHDGRKAHYSYLMDLDINGRKEVLGIHMYGDDKIELSKRCGDHYETLMDKMVIKVIWYHESNPIC
jgi:hypothetical protein